VSLTIELTPAEEAHLAEAARREGIPPGELARRLLTRSLLAEPKTEREEDPTLTLFARWDSEDATMTREEVEAEDRRWEEFKTNINAERDRAGARRVF
jgi:hypothetical protein